MSRQTLNNAESLYNIRTKINANFAELYTFMQSMSGLIPTAMPTATPTPTPTSTSTVTPTPTPTPTATSTPTPTPTSTPGDIVIPFTDYLEGPTSSLEDVELASTEQDLFFFDVEDVSIIGSPAIMDIYVADEQRARITFDGGRIGKPFGYMTSTYTGTELQFQGNFVAGEVNF